MAEVQVLQAPRSARRGRDHRSRPHAPAAGLDGAAEQPAPLDGFERQRGALLDHLVPAREREGQGADGGACFSRSAECAWCPQWMRSDAACTRPWGACRLLEG